MSLRLNNGSNYQLLNTEGKDATNSSKPNDKNISLEIDVNGNGQFGDKDDITIKDSAQIKLLLDETPDNAGHLTEIPFVEEIESHIIASREISKLLDTAKEFGIKAKNTNALFNSSKKIHYGKTALHAVKKAYEKDPANSIARFSFAMSIASIKDSFWKEKAESAMELDVDKEAPKLMNALAADKYDVMGQLMLQKLYTLYEKETELADLNQWLTNLKSQQPEAFQEGMQHYQEAQKH